MRLEGVCFCLVSICIAANLTKSVSLIPRVSAFFIHTKLVPKGSIHLRSTSRNIVDAPYIVERSEFPALINPEARNLIYFDNAATTQKPRAVIETMLEYYTTYCSNVHRSQHLLGSTASSKYEHARKNVAKFINASSSSEIVFTSGATEAINLVAYTWCLDNVKRGDAIIIPISEHNSNIVPWQLHTTRSESYLHFIKITETGDIDIDDYLNLLRKGNVKLVSLGHASNVLGKLQHLKSLIALAHEHEAKVLVDACQTLAHVKVNVKDLDCDFLVGSAHKVYGPTGIGFLYAKRSILESMSPWKGGGGMVKSITYSNFDAEDVPHLFEPGTPPIAQAIGFSAAIDFINKIGLEKIASYEHGLVSHLYDLLSQIAVVYTTKENVEKQEQCPMLAFTVPGVNPFDLSSLLSAKNVAIRAGQHCAMLLHQEHLNVDKTLRASLAMYNTKEDIDKFIYHLSSTVKTLHDIKSR